MIPNDKLVARAEKFARAHRPGGNADLDGLVASFQRAQELGASDHAVQAHASSMLRLADAFAAADVEDVEAVPAKRQTAKRAAAKKATAKKATARRKD